MFFKFMGICITLAFLTSCASHPAPRPAYTDIPPLKNGWSRVKITSGKYDWARLWTTEQLGPVFINDQPVWDAAKDEYIIIDLLPGSYELSWTPRASYKVYTEKRQFTFRAGETRHFACDMAAKGGAIKYFGLVGLLATDYVAGTYLEERPMDNLNSIPVAYKSFNSAPVQSDRHVEIEKSIPSPPIKTDATQSTENSSVYERLEKLKKLYEKELITKDEYDKERQELLDEL
jgi:hypothetical protein